MSDLISRKALIEKIRKYGICGSGYSDEERINDVIDMIESEPSAQQWIPCSERLPEEDGEYLIWYDCGYGTDNPSDDDEKGYMIMNFDVGMNSFVFLGSEFIYCETAVAWMPLPEPMKTKE